MNNVRCYEWRWEWWGERSCQRTGVLVVRGDIEADSFGGGHGRGGRSDEKEKARGREGERENVGGWVSWRMGAGGRKYRY